MVDRESVSAAARLALVNLQEQRRGALIERPPVANSAPSALVQEGQRGVCPNRDPLLRAVSLEPRTRAGSALSPQLPIDFEPIHGNQVHDAYSKSQLVVSTSEQNTMSFCCSSRDNRQAALSTTDRILDNRLT